MIAFRDETAKRLGLELIVHTNQQGLKDGINPFTHGSSRYTDIMKTVALRQALDAGVNFIDVYMRTGLYPIELPAVLGMEAAGVVEAVGEGVDRFAIGDRVAYPMCQGAYAEARLIAADRLVALIKEHGRWVEPTR